MLIAVEGISGCGKGSLIACLQAHLGSRGVTVQVTSWNSDERVSPVLGQMKYKKRLSPVQWSTVHAIEVRRRFLKEVKPSLGRSKEHVVIADRWLPTAVARDGARGVPASVVHQLYDGLPNADLVLYLDVAPEVALQRRLARHNQLYFYSSGADIFGEPLERAFVLYSRRQQEAYVAQQSDNWVTIDGRMAAAEVAARAIEVVETWLERGRTG
jgi:dTMP kinase